MKKLLGIICIIALLFSCSAMAEDAKEYTFQGILWGSSTEESYQALIEAVLVLPIVADLDVWAGSGAFLAYDDEMCALPGIISPYENVISRILIGKDYLLKKIAGYDVKNIGLSFAMNGDAMKLITAELNFEVKNTDEAFADMQTKLTSVYGDGKACSLWGIIENVVWLGENSTAIMLYRETSSEGMYLYYGTLDAASILDECLANYVEQTNNVDSSDTSGL